MPRIRLTAYVILAAALLLVSLLGAQVTGSAWSSAATGPGGTVPTRTPPTPMPVNVELRVTLQRPNAPPPHPSWAVPVHFAFYAPGDEATELYAWDLTLDQNGAWQGTLMTSPGTYDLRLKNMHTLRNVKRNVTVAEGMIVDMGTLHEGDADDDNRVRSSDFGILRAAYFTNEGEPGFDPRTDFDEDDRIRSSDFALLRASYFETGDLEVAAALASAARPWKPEQPAPDAPAPDGTVALALEPARTRVAPGETFTLTLIAHAGDQPFVALDAEIHFPPDQLQVVGSDGALATTIEGLPPFTELTNKVNNAAGQIVFGAGTFGDPLRGETPAAQIRFRAVGNGPWALIQFIEASVADETGKWVTGPLSDALALIGDQARSLYLPLIHRAN